MVKGLARHGHRLRHDRMVKHVDASLFVKKSGYSPMTCGCYQACSVASLKSRGEMCSLAVDATHVDGRFGEA